ncbi:MAG: glycosyltransferase family 4 protein [Leptolyngbyaceae cyanobacterium SM1_1_3]|nr:glycosyltransferase family 4 protein [Leptolyngbyaceae cyanobacterium SM1_1_3]NJN01560.1 glycosyltransferase family 4 protein [Leptolyngbyaceae cyanobacterium RM1_1_2]NJO09831.1 glycosyltransferase family 4 protein [Leptolyngbyaceae cyanobacterium SL_1_1]
MRILIYSYNYHPEPIGIAPLMTELAEGLVKQGHQVRVITAMPNYPERRIYPEYRGKLYHTEEVNGVTIQRCYVSIRPNPGLVTRILLDGSFILLSFFQALKGWRPDVILATSPSLPACLPVALLKWVYSCPTILNLQDILPEAAVRTGLISNKFAIRVFEILEKFAYQSATKISVITEGFAENLVGKEVSRDRMVCIPNWVDTNFIRPLSKHDNAFRRAHSLEGKFVVLYSGNIARTQGIRTIIRAAALLKTYPEIAFVISGEERQLAHLDALKQDLDATNVLLLPFAAREDLPEMLAASDVGLIMQKKSMVGFNMPSKTQVLLASGRPIIASVPSDGSAAKAVDRSGGGLVVQPENPTSLAKAIFYLFKHPEKAEKLGYQGRRHAETHYSFHQALQAYEELFDELNALSSSRVTSASKALSDLRHGL